MPPKQKSKSRLETEQPVKAWEQGLQLAVFSEEVCSFMGCFFVYSDENSRLAIGGQRSV